MRNFWRDYGIIGVLIAIAVGGYFLIGERKNDILSYSLDAIGNRLIELVDDDARKEDVADAFSRFKDRVSSKEVAPEQIENIAANVLNLSTSGAQLSPEEAEMVLDLALESPADVLPIPQILLGELPAATDKVTPVSPPSAPGTVVISDDQLVKLGSRVTAMVSFAEKMKEMAASDKKVKDFSKHYHFTFDDGLRIVVDTMADTVWAHEELRELVSELDREKWVDWRQNLVEERRVRDERIQKVKERISIARRQEGVVVSRLPGEWTALVKLERLNRLQELGLVVNMDTALLRMRIDITIREAMKRFEESLEAAKEAAVRVESN